MSIVTIGAPLGAEHGIMRYRGGLHGFGDVLVTRKTGVVDWRTHHKGELRRMGIVTSGTLILSRFVDIRRIGQCGLFVGVTTKALLGFVTASQQAFEVGFVRLMT